LTYYLVDWKLGSFLFKREKTGFMFLKEMRRVIKDEDIALPN
jgi:hypothetical protein